MDSTFIDPGDGHNACPRTYAQELGSSRLMHRVNHFNIRVKSGSVLAHVRIGTAGDSVERETCVWTCCVGFFQERCWVRAMAWRESPQPLCRTCPGALREASSDLSCSYTGCQLGTWFAARCARQWLVTDPGTFLSSNRNCSVRSSSCDKFPMYVREDLSTHAKFIILHVTIVIPN